MILDMKFTSTERNILTASLTPITAVAASEKGAVAGFETRCTCGLVIRSSLRTMIEQDAANHLEWHSKRSR